MRSSYWLAGIGAAAAGLAVWRRTRPRRDTANVPAAGRRKSLKTMLLEAGAAVLQPMDPLRQFDVYMVGFHPMKNDPAHQMEAHHFCRQINEDLMQCVLFSGNTRDARLNGIEYIISERLYETLPEEERQYWHPHNYEVLSGTLAAPGVPAIAERELMRQKINSYGKTWHTWKTGSVDTPGDGLPLGPAMLAWSFNRDGELRPRILEDMERESGIDTATKRRERACLAESAHPQHGEGELREALLTPGK